MVIVIAEDGLSHRTIPLGRLCRHEDWNDNSITALLMEVLQIQRIIPDLLFVIDQERLGTNLEFDGENHAPHEEDNIDSFP